MKWVVWVLLLETLGMHALYAMEHMQHNPSKPCIGAALTVPTITKGTININGPDYKFIQVPWYFKENRPKQELKRADCVVPLQIIQNAIKSAVIIYQSYVSSAFALEKFSAILLTTTPDDTNQLLVRISEHEVSPYCSIILELLTRNVSDFPISYQEYKAGYKFPLCLAPAIPAECYEQFGIQQTRVQMVRDYCVDCRITKKIDFFYNKQAKMIISAYPKIIVKHAEWPRQLECEYNPWLPPCDSNQHADSSEWSDAEQNRNK